MENEGTMNNVPRFQLGVKLAWEKGYWWFPATRDEVELRKAVTALERAFPDEEFVVERIHAAGPNRNK